MRVAAVRRCGSPGQPTKTRCTRKCSRAQPPKRGDVDIKNVDLRFRGIGRWLEPADFHIRPLICSGRRRLSIRPNGHQFTGCATSRRKFPTQLKSITYARFSEHLVTNTFLLMTVVMQVKPLYLMDLPSLRTASDQSVTGNDIMQTHMFKPTGRQRAL